MATYPARIRNPLTRPVEIHRAGGVEVLGPGAELVLAAPDAAVERLAAMGLLTRHAVAPPPAAPPIPFPALAGHEASRPADAPAPRRVRERPPSGETP